MVSALLKIMAPLSRRVRLMVGRCVLKLVDDSLPIQKVQITILDGEVHDGVERVQNFGFSSVPLAGARGVTLAIGGDRAHQVIVAMDDGRHRPQGLEGGESALYNSHGVCIWLRKDGIAQIDALEINLGGDRGELHRFIDERFKVLFDVHAHSGVMAGSALTGPPTAPLDLVANATDKVRGH